jgi:hypothetical protein
VREGRRSKDAAAPSHRTPARGLSRGMVPQRPPRGARLLRLRVAPLRPRALQGKGGGEGRRDGLSEGQCGRGWPGGPAGEMRDGKAR